MRFKMLRCLTQTPSVPAVTMQKPGKQRALAGRISAFFFFFLRTFMWIFLQGERRPVLFLGFYSYILELIRWPHWEGCKDIPLETGSSSGQWFLLIPSKYFYPSSCLQESPSFKRNIWSASCCLPLFGIFDSVNTLARIPLFFHCAKRRKAFLGYCRNRYANELRMGMIYHSLKVLLCDVKAVLEER